MLRRAGRLQDALAWYARATDAGDPVSSLQAAAMLREANRIEDALVCYARAADAGDPRPPFNW